MRVAAREQDDIAATHALDVRVAVDPKREFALLDDVQGAGPTPAYRLLDLDFARYATASDAAAEAGALVGATLEHATGGVVIAFAQVLDDA